MDAVFKKRGTWSDIKWRKREDKFAADDAVLIAEKENGYQELVKRLIK